MQIGEVMHNEKRFELLRKGLTQMRRICDLFQISPAFVIGGSAPKSHER
jgi:hypothetical protein